MGIGPGLNLGSSWMRAAELDLDLDVFAGPFDLLMTVVLREEVALAEVELGEIVIAYLEHVENRASSTSRRRPSSWS